VGTDAWVGRSVLQSSVAQNAIGVQLKIKRIKAFDDYFTRLGREIHVSVSLVNYVEARQRMGNY